MTPDQAVKLLGARAVRFQVNQMIHALSLHPWSNSEEENKRLEAAKWAQRNWPAFTKAAQARRERKN